MSLPLRVLSSTKKSILPCSWIRRLKIIKITRLPKHIFRFTIIPTKIPIRFFMELGDSNTYRCVEFLPLFTCLHWGQCFQKPLPYVVPCQS